MNSRPPNDVLSTNINPTAIVTDTLISKKIVFDDLSQSTGIEITDAVVHEICETNPFIIEINLNNCHQITDASLLHVGTYCKNLEAISLRGCDNLTHIGLRSLAIHCTCIQRLDCVDCTFIDDSNLRILAASLRSLTHLNLKGCSLISDRGLSEVAQCCRKLRYLNLQGCFKIGESGAWSLKQLGNNCLDLEELDFNGCKYISGAGLLSIARGCKSLQRIDISGCISLSGKALVKIFSTTTQIRFVAAPYCHPAIDIPVGQGIVEQISSTVVSLDLSYCISVGIEILESISHCSRLSKLKLSGCLQVDDEAISLLVSGSCKLISLELNECIMITSRSVESLVPKDGDGLSYLGLNGCSEINSSFLVQIAPSFVFSTFVCSDAFVGFCPLPTEQSLREKATEKKLKRDGAQLIQRVMRGVIVRRGEYQERKKEWTIENKLPKIQALIRGHIQLSRTRRLRQDVTKNGAVTTIASVFRGYSYRKMQAHLKYLANMEIRRNKAAICIQRSYHCFVAKTILSTLRFELIQQQLEERKENARKDEAATLIQRNTRGFIQMQHVKRLRQSILDRIHEEQRRNTASLVLQKYIRSYQGRTSAKLKQLEQQRLETLWFHSRTIQSLWRGMKGRQNYEGEKKARELEIWTKSAVFLQRLWRGHEGRHYVKYLRGFQALRRREQDSAIIIQRVYRGKRGRSFCAKKIAYIEEVARRNMASSTIGKVFRGYKGREEACIAKALKMIKWELQPLIEEKTSKENEVLELTITLENMESKLEQMSRSQAEFENELATIGQTRSEFVDTNQITGALQRCSKVLVNGTLTQKLESVKINILATKKKKELLIIQKKECHAEIRALGRKISSLESETTMKIKVNRVKKLRAQVYGRPHVLDKNLSI